MLVNVKHDAQGLQRRFRRGAGEVRRGSLLVHANAL